MLHVLAICPYSCKWLLEGGGQTLNHLIQFEAAGVEVAINLLMI